MGDSRGLVNGSGGMVPGKKERWAVRADPFMLASTSGLQNANMIATAGYR